MASKPIVPITPRYPNYRLGADYIQSETNQKRDQEFELKIQVLKEFGFYSDNMSVEEINEYYQQISIQQQTMLSEPKSSINVEKKVIMSPATASPKIIEKKLTADTKLVEIQAMPELKVENNSSNNSTNSTNSTHSTPAKNSAREMIRNSLSQLVTDDITRQDLLSNSNNDLSNISIESITGFILTLYEKNGGVSDIQNEFLLVSGYFGSESSSSSKNEISNASSPFGNIIVLDKTVYTVTNAGENKGNGACGINWISLALRLGYITMGPAERNLFEIDETSENDNKKFRRNIIEKLYYFRGAGLKNAIKNSTLGEGVLSALFENIFPKEFVNEGYYITPEEVYAIAYMLLINVKILIWQEDHAEVYCEQTTRGHNQEPIYLYLWNSHYYLMKRNG